MNSGASIKLMYFEKATKFCEIFALLLTTVHKVKSKVKIFQNFVAFSYCLNFTSLIRVFDKTLFLDKLKMDGSYICSRDESVKNVCMIHSIIKNSIIIIGYFSIFVHIFGRKHVAKPRF